MPIYEYHCKSCDKVFEYLVMGSGDAPDCPACSGKDVARQMSACGFISKGEGGAPAKTAATSLDPAQISVTTTTCTPGQPVTLTVSYPFTYDIPLFGSNTIAMTGTGVMRCGG